MDSRLRVARGLAKTETQASIEVFECLKRRGHPHLPPPNISDGWGGIEEALLSVYGKVPPYSGRGRRPVHKRAQAGWQYIQMVKQRENGTVIGTDVQVIYGDEQQTLELLGGATAYVERPHLTMRHFNARLHRKTLAYSKALRMHRASAAWEDVYYNLALPHKSLRQKVTDDPTRRWIPRTPAMAAGLTDHIWTVKELLNAIPTPSNT
jgi:hypothetical protein